MSNKFCCITWSELGPELAEFKENEITMLMEEKGLPRSMFAGILRVVKGMSSHCPVCGSNLSVEDIEDEPVRKTVPVPPATPPQKRVCPKCKGNRILGRDANNVAIRCMNCLGSGYLQKNVHLPTEDGAKVKLMAEENSSQELGVVRGEL